ncbi:hypothetical protein BN1232_04471 [Mycobacterium lentiflavum]|uniref:DUF732 domain-containing protein n=1 Tax=Mycobacterium lentiflavum TaxID=141349 RepID=A0A0E4CPY8_MYCLN|nr:DUF732 domain-containing protein [Mycobacterium lentiflavum]MEE3065816.1 DUF732 domain-containing protein [Actinomycetota bacterium]ULP41243.1 DUF732 domain-containing protein [Mycobacterium lentiflavum]CQD19178.1 hypothetical protein BN1232_04471 [Mycobacterium lentiflavum]
MFTRRINTIASTIIGAAAIGIVAVGTAGTAGATTTEDAFLAQMDKLGISFSSPADAIKDGHKVCQELAAGKTGTDIAAEILQQTDLTSHQAAYFVVDATHAFCPALAPQLT